MSQTFTAYFRRMGHENNSIYGDGYTGTRNFSDAGQRRADRRRRRLRPRCERSARGQEAINKITAFQNEQIAAITGKQKEATDLETRLRNQERALSEATRTQLTKNLETTRWNIQTMQEEAQ